MAGALLKTSVMGAARTHDTGRHDREGRHLQRMKAKRNSDRGRYQNHIFTKTETTAVLSEETDT